MGNSPGKGQGSHLINPHTNKPQDTAAYSGHKGKEWHHAERSRRVFADFQKIQSNSAKRWSEEIERSTGIAALLEEESQELVQKYQVTLPISCGMSAIVYKGINKETNEDVSIKIARIHIGGHISDLARRKDCKEEAEIQMQCKHPNVVELYDFYLGPRYAIYVMEFVPNTLLERIVERNSSGVYSERETARYIQETALGLKACHKQKVIHLDIKLDNILCADDGTVKICDFGVSARISHKKVKRSVAAPMFSPPEIIREGSCDTKADMWSLGVVLYILLCGYPPFSDENGELQKRIVKARYVFPSKHWGGISIMARDLVSRLLVLDTRKRYSADQVLSHPWIIALESATYQSKQTDSCASLDEGQSRKLQEQNLFHKAKKVTSFLRNWHMCRKLEKHGVDLPAMLDQSDEVLDILSEKTLDWTDFRLQLNREALKVFKPLRKQLNTISRMYQRSISKSLLENAESEETRSSESDSVCSAGSDHVSEGTSKPVSKALKRVQETSTGGLGMRKSSSTPNLGSLGLSRQQSFNVVPTKAPDWIADEEASYCRLCDTNFSLFQRRHHCRGCGQVVCESCSSSRRALDHMQDSLRHRCCDLCSLQFY